MIVDPDSPLSVLRRVAGHARTGNCENWIVLQSAADDIERLRRELAEARGLLVELGLEHDRVLKKWAECVEARHADFMRAPFSATDAGPSDSP